MAKYNYALAGNSSHIHNSLWSADGKTPLFYRQEGGVLDDAADAHHGSPASSNMRGSSPGSWRPTSIPTSASRSGTFAPTKIIWSRDNRTAGFRLCGEGTKGIRIECRIGGADLNPYLAFAALIAAGLAGVDEKLELAEAVRGRCLSGGQAARNPEDVARGDRNAGEVEDAEGRRSATTSSSTMCTPRKWEQFEYDRRITDWELHRGFERY